MGFIRSAFAVTATLLLFACPAEMGADAGPVGDGGRFAFEFKNHSFSFENYTNELNGAAVTNLTPVEIARLFGDGVCTEGPDAGACTLTPSSRNFMESTNGAMKGGHCEGMAVLSLLFATGQAKPSDFGAPTAFGLTLVNNEPLQREIAYWWATQSTQPTQSADTRGKSSPTEVLALLETWFAGGGESYSFGLYKRDGSGGHANTPYSIRTVDAGIKEVVLYENNFPNAVMAVTIDTNTNSWTYTATTNPTSPSEVYDGDATTKSLTLTSTSARTQRQTCPTCGTVNANGRGVKGNAVSYRELGVEGSARVVISDGLSHSIALDGGSYQSTIPGAEIAGGRSAPTTWTEVEQPRFRVPLTTPLTVTLDGTGLSAASPSAVRLTAPGYTFAVQGVSLDPGQVDTIIFAGDSDHVAYTTTGAETPVVELGLTLDGTDYLFEVTGVAETTGVTIDLKVDVPTQKLAVKISSTDGSASYGLKVHALSSGDVVFAHQGNTVSSTATVHLNYGTWAGQGTPMTFEVDDDSNGTIEQTLMVTDDGD